MPASSGGRRITKVQTRPALDRSNRCANTRTQLPHENLGATVLESPAMRIGLNVQIDFQAARFEMLRPTHARRTTRR